MRTTALILVGGLASRMQGKAKCLLPLGDGRSILEHLVDALTRSGIDIVVLGQLPIEETAAWEGSDVLFLPDAEPHAGTGRAISGAAKFLNHRRAEQILVCYGDTFLPGFNYASACFPETITVGIAPDDGNVSIDGEGAKYDLDTFIRSRWIELGATCIRFDQLGDVGNFRHLPDWLRTRTFHRVCIHDGLVLTTGDPANYDVARSWTP